jgi:hypothetical protein
LDMKVLTKVQGLTGAVMASLKNIFRK